MTTVIFTDLDGTLLDRDTYSWDAARPAVQLLRDRTVPLVLVTSKTRAEVQHWRRVLGNDHPFAVENGGAIFVPGGYFGGGIPGAARRNGYEVIVYGKPYVKLIAGLEAASRMSRCRVRGFHEMTVEEIAALCQLPAEQALLAKQREYDEPFEILDLERLDELESAIAAQGLSGSRGGRFHHVSGQHDKGCAVKLLASLFRRANGRVTTIGLGDSVNDIPLLLAVDIPVVVRSRDVTNVVRLVPNALVADHKGPEGWSEAILEILRGILGNQDESAWQAKCSLPYRGADFFVGRENKARE